MCKRHQGSTDDTDVFRVDDPCLEPRVLYELRQKKMAEDAENNIAIHFVDEND